VTDAHTTPAQTSRSLSAVVVGLSDGDRLMAFETLSAAGFEVTLVERFDAARARLVSNPPAVLLTAIKLGEFNGLHLVLAAKIADPRIAAIVTIEAPDPVLEKEAEQLGATFLVQPTSVRELLAAVLRTYLRSPADTTPIRPPFERRYRERRLSHLSSYTPERRGHDRRRELSLLLRRN